MKTTATASRAIALFAAALALGACVETTEPVDIVEVRVAHAAPGLPTQALLMEGEELFNVPPLQAVFFPLRTQPVTYSFVSGTETAERHVASHAEINAVILMDPDQPTVHHFPMERRLFQIRIQVINGDFTTTEPLTIRVARNGFEFEESIAPGGHAVMEPEAGGTFNLSARPAGEEDFMTIEPFTIVQGDNGFLVVLPHDQADGQYIRMLF
jgi:hypothetical protein